MKHSPRARRRWLVLATLALAGTIVATPLHADEQREPPSPAKAQRTAVMWTFVPFGAGLAVALLPLGDTTQRLGGALALTGLEMGPWVGYESAGLGRKAALGWIGRTVILVGAGVAASSIKDSGPNKEPAAFAVGAMGLIGALFWAAHDVRRLGPLVEAKSASSLNLGPAWDRDGNLLLSLNARF